MSPEIISSILVGCGGFAATLMQCIFSAKTQKERHNVLFLQLTSLYAPLDKLFVMTPASPKRAERVQRLIFDHYELAPPELLHAWQYWKKEQKSDAETAFSNLIAACYERARKQLGYPYDKCRLRLSPPPKIHVSQDTQLFIRSILILVWFFTAEIIVMRLCGVHTLPRGFLFFSYLFFPSITYLFVCLAFPSLHSLIRQRACRVRKSKSASKPK